MAKGDENHRAQQSQSRLTECQESMAKAVRVHYSKICIKSSLARILIGQFASSAKSLIFFDFQSQSNFHLHAV